MKNKKDNKMLFILTILKSPEIEYNANNISPLIGISSMGALKIAKNLEKEGILLSRKIGRANIYKINFKNDYAKQYIKFLLKKEVEESSPYVKRWIRELEKMKIADTIILFGSVLKKEKDAGDIDTLIIVNKKNFEKVKKEIESINLLNDKKIHPIYQTMDDLKKHIDERNKVVLNAVKGIIISGEENILGVLQ
ncbi:MAG: nucleotidyltransferase domain-containing protein [Nanoarchaeota archaeon]|nr:nucleotidyltransferase domain-containing protein [Nanoarchaeota archaeon]